MKTIGVVGLGLTNPYLYAPILKEMGARVGYVWDYEPDNARDYARAFACETVASLDAYPAVDGVLIDARNADHCALARRFLKRDIPVYIEKPLSHDPDEALSFLDEFPHSPFFSSSPLRFAEPYLRMKRDVLERGERLLQCKVSINHTMDAFVNNPLKRWHDDPAESGGMLVDIGIHAVELLNLLMPQRPLRVSYLRTRSFYQAAHCYDNHAVTIEYADHSVGILSLLCATRQLDYAVEAYGAEHEYLNGAHHVYGNMGGFNPENAYGGFRQTMAAFLKMLDTGEPPIAREETRRNFELLKQILNAETKTREE